MINKTLDGLFTKLTLKEAKTRQDVLARSNDLLKKYFSRSYFS
ncbi:MAG: DUF4197 family protein [Gammaproteobacteria bacterium]|nr:DUF4197 family protein [Gammaproteobacteria bacterium]